MRVLILPLSSSLLAMSLLASDVTVASIDSAPDPESPLVVRALPADPAGRTLFDLIREGDPVHVAEFLDAHPESIRQPNDDLYSPLAVAIDRSLWDVAQLLVKRGADLTALTKRKETPLLLAAQKNATALVAALLDKKADPNAIDLNGQTALHYAVRSNNQEAVAALLSHGASVDLVEPSHGYTPVALALSLDHDSLAQQMIAAQISPEATPLFVAIRNNKFDEFESALNAHPERLDIRVAGGWSLLHQAVLDNRTEHVNYLLSHGFDTLARDCGQRAALHIAALAGNADMALRLIQAKADPNVVDQRGLAPLSLAIRRNDRATVELLLLNGADPNILDAAGHTSAYELIHCDETVASLLFRHGVHLNVRDKIGRTVLFYTLDDPARTALLINNGAAVNPKDVNGCSLLHEAALHAPAKVVDLLIAAEVPLEEPDGLLRTPLHTAVIHANLPAVQSLVSHGANLNARDKSGDTPLHYAVYNLPITALLLERHACCDMIDQRGNTTPLDIASRSGDPDARFLLQAHLDTLAAAKTGDLAALQAVYTALSTHQADLVKAGRADAAALFASAPASVNLARNRDGATPLMLACAGGFQPMAAALIRAGANPAARDQRGFTPLMFAAQNNHVTVVQLLVQQKVEIDAINDQSRTALHLAAAQNSLAAVKLLVAAQAARSTLDADGHTAADLAAAANAKDVVAYFTALKAPPAP